MPGSFVDNDQQLARARKRMPSPDPFLVVVAAPTFHRPERLRILLPQLVAQAESARAAFMADPEDGHAFPLIRIVIVDNSPEGDARDQVEQCGLPRVEYAHQPTPGIGAARNMTLDGARDADVLVCLDDDERPHDRWLELMLRTWIHYRPAAVAGRVLAEFDPELEVDPWLVAGDFFTRRSLPTGTVVDAAPAGNLLLHMPTITELGLRFNEETGLTGGEDTEFTRALVAAGRTIVFCDEAAIVDLVPAARANRRWVLMRALSQGNIAARLRQVPQPVLGVLGVGRMAAGGAQIASGLVGRSLRSQARGARLGARGAGFLLAGLGLRYDEYARPASDGRVHRVVWERSGEPLELPAFRSAGRRRPAPRAHGVKGWAKSLLGHVAGSVVRVAGPLPQVVLTFDDGPDPDVTPQLLEVLARHGATATFFVLGTRVQRWPELVVQMVEEGHEVAVHGVDHGRVPGRPRAEMTSALTTFRAELAALTGTPIRWYRPPHGAQTLATWQMVRRIGMVPVFWSGTTWDWKEVSHEERLAKAASVTAGAIVLAHDGAGDAPGTPFAEVPPDLDKAALLDELLTVWTQRGWQVRSLADALAGGARPVREAVFSR